MPNFHLFLTPLPVSHDELSPSNRNSYQHNQSNASDTRYDPRLLSTALSLSATAPNLASTRIKSSIHVFL